jgi:quercetin dioxygenase-like cupin family protein/DNA-binding XRE family transcriptional regulator
MPKGMGVEAFRQLRSIRQAKGISLKEMAERTGLSSNYLSQIERGKANPSISVLKRITDTLAVPYMSLVEPSRSLKDDGIVPVQVVKANKRKMLVYPGGQRRAYLLTPDLRGKLEVILTVEKPETEGSGDWYSHEGEEFGLVLEGSYEVMVENRVFRLEEGDSIRFVSSIPHKMRNPGAKLSKTLWVITPPSF